MYYLQNFDYTHINLREAPKTQALLEQKICSLRPEENWWLDMLMGGQLPNQDGWSGICGTDDMFDSYQRHAKDTGVMRRSISTKIGQFLKNTVPNLSKHDGAYKVAQGEFGEDPVKGRYYRLPALEECRKAFEAALGQSIDWE